MAKFEQTSCSQCGGEFGPGDSGYSHCQDHGPKMLKGEGERVVIEKTRVRRSCGYCGEPAFYQNTYLADGDTGARNNPASSAYRKDDLSWCSDFDDYLCPDCHQANETDNVPDGHGWCSTFQVDRFPHMFLRWDERELETEKAIS
ncbi:MAG: hypothetical protein V3U60_16480 [Gammaproteobacteria bacterium]